MISRIFEVHDEVQLMMDLAKDENKLETRLHLYKQAMDNSH